MSEDACGSVGVFVGFGSRTDSHRVQFFHHSFWWLLCSQFTNGHVKKVLNQINCPVPHYILYMYVYIE